MAKQIKKKIVIRKPIAPPDRYVKEDQVPDELETDLLNKALVEEPIPKQSFWDKYKVAILGGISAICIALAPYIQSEKIEPIAIGYAAVVAIGSYIANNFRGQWVTITGVIITSGINVLDILMNNGHVDIKMVLFGLVISVGMAASGPFKSRNYEHATPIVKAKAEAKAITEIKKSTT